MKAQEKGPSLDGQKIEPLPLASVHLMNSEDLKVPTDKVHTMKLRLLLQKC